TTLQAARIRAADCHGRGGVPGRRPDRREVRAVGHRPAGARSHRARAGDRRGDRQNRTSRADAARGRAGAEQLRGPVPLARAAGGEPMKVTKASLAIAAVLLTAGPPAFLPAQALDRTKPPALPSPPPLKLPAVQTATLPSGLELAVVEMHKVPVVDVQIVLDAGAARDPADLPGLATFTA